MTFDVVDAVALSEARGGEEGRKESLQKVKFGRTNAQRSTYSTMDDAELFSSEAAADDAVLRAQLCDSAEFRSVREPRQLARWLSAVACQSRPR